MQQPDNADKANKKPSGELGQCYVFIYAQRNLQTLCREEVRGKEENRALKVAKKEQMKEKRKGDKVNAETEDD